MKLPRISVGAVMAGLVVVAADCVIYRSIRSRPDSLANELGMIVQATLPMANLLALVVAGLVGSRAPNRPRRVGFAVGGSIALVATFFGLEPALSLIEWAVTRGGLERWLAASPTREQCVVFLVVVAMPLLFQACAGLAGGTLGRWIGDRRPPRPVASLSAGRSRPASLATLVLLAAIPAVAVEGILRRQVDPILVRLAVGLEAVVDLANPPGGPLPIPKGSPIRRMAGVKVRVESDREPVMIEMVVNSKTRDVSIRDRRAVEVTLLDGPRAGEATRLPQCLLRPIP